MHHSPFDECAVGQADAVLPQDVRNRQRNAHMSGNISQPLVKLFELLDRRRGKDRNKGCSGVATVTFSITLISHFTAAATRITQFKICFFFSLV